MSFFIIAWLRQQMNLDSMLLYQTAQVTKVAMSLDDAQRLMDAHLDGSTDSHCTSNIHEARRVMQVSGVFPITREKRGRDIAFDAPVDSAKHQKTDTPHALDSILGLSPSPAPFDDSAIMNDTQRFVGDFKPAFDRRRTGEQWSRDILEAQQAFAPRAERYAELSERLTFEFNERYFGTAAASKMRSYFADLARSFGEAFANVQKHGDVRSAEMARVLRAFSNFKQEMILYRGGQAALDRYNARQADESIGFIVDSILDVFVHSSDETLARVMGDTSAVEAFAEQHKKHGVHKKHNHNDEYKKHVSKQQADVMMVGDDLNGKNDNAKESSEFFSADENSSEFYEAEADVMYQLYVIVKYAASTVCRIPEFALKLLDIIWPKINAVTTWLSAPLEHAGRWEDVPAAESVPTQRPQSVWLGWMTKRAIGVLKFLLGSFLVGSAWYASYTYVRSYLDPTAHFVEIKQRAAAMAQTVDAAGELTEKSLAAIESVVAKDEQEKYDSIIGDPKAELSANFINEILDSTNTKVMISEEGFFPLWNEKVLETADSVIAQLENEKNNPRTTAAGSIARDMEINAWKIERDNYIKGVREKDEDAIFEGFRFILLRRLSSPLKIEYEKLLEQNHEFVSVFKTLCKNLGGIKELLTKVSEDVKRNIADAQAGLDKLALTENATPCYSAFFNFISDRVMPHVTDKTGVFFGRSFMGMVDNFGLGVFRQLEFTFFNIIKDVSKIVSPDPSVSAALRIAQIANVTTWTGISAVLMAINNEWVAVAFEYLTYGTIGLLQLLNKGLWWFSREVLLTLLGDKSIFTPITSWLSIFSFSLNCSEETLRLIEGKLNGVFKFVHESLGAVSLYPRVLLKSIGLFQTVYSLVYLLLPLFVSGSISVLFLGNVVTVGLFGLTAGMLYAIHRYTGFPIVTHISNVFIRHPYLSSFGISMVQVIIAWIIYYFGFEKFTFSAAILDKEVTDQISNGSLSDLIPLFDKPLESFSAFANKYIR